MEPRRWWRHTLLHWPDVVPYVLTALVLAGAPAWVHWRLLTGFADEYAIRAGDFTEVKNPLYAFVVQSWQQQELPLWTPYVNAGHSAFADMQFDAFYPPTGLTGLLLGRAGAFTPRLLTAIEIAQVYVAELGMFLLALALLASSNMVRPSGARRHWACCGSAVASAWTFAFSGYLLSYPIEDTVILQASVWLPWCVLGLHWALRRRSVLRAAVAGVPLGLTILTGHPPVLLYVWCASAVFVIYEVVIGYAPRIVKTSPVPEATPVRPMRPALDKLHLLALGLLAHVSGLALSMVQLWPALQFAPLTIRGAESYAFRSDGFAPHELSGLVLREGLAGAPPLYLGGAALVCATAGVLTRRFRTRGYALALIIGGLLLSLGGDTAVYSLAHLLVTGFNLIRDQEPAVFLFTFGVAIAVAPGVVSLCSLTKQRPVFRTTSWITALLVITGACVLTALLAIAASSVMVTASAQASLVSDADGLMWLSVVVAMTASVLEVARQTLELRVIAPWLLAGLIGLDLAGAHSQQGIEPATGARFPSWPIISLLQAGSEAPFRISSEGLLPADRNEGLINHLQDVVGSTPLEYGLFAQIDAADTNNQTTELQ